MTRRTSDDAAPALDGAGSVAGRELRSAGDAVNELEGAMVDIRRRLGDARERRRAAVLAARAEGASYADIGGVLGVSAQRARAIASDVVFAARRAAAREAGR